jgi:hypothetical protein
MEEGDDVSDLATDPASELFPAYELGPALCNRPFMVLVESSSPFLSAGPCRLRFRPRVREREK